MNADLIIRTSWVILTGAGFLLLMFALREVFLDNLAVDDSSQRGVAMVKQQTRAAVLNQSLICLALLCHLTAGVGSFFQLATLALAMLFIGDGLFIVLGLCLIQQRRSLAHALRLRKRITS